MEVGGRTRVRNREGRGVPKRHTLGTKHRNHNFSPGRFWREKSFVLPLLRVHYLPFLKIGVTLAVFQSSGTIPVNRDSKIILVTG